MLANQGAPVNNFGYYDTPICNELSNKEYRDRPVSTSNFELNQDINLTVNDNHGRYKVYQDPTIPSPSLYLECDRSFSGYYYKDPLTLSYDGSSPLVKKKEQSTEYNYINSDLHPPFGIENFRGGGGGGGGGGHGGGGGGHGGGGGGGHGGGGHGGGGHGGGGHGGHGAGYGRGYGHGGHRGGGYPRSYLPANGYASNFPYSNGYGNGYLNTVIMPNVSTAYWDYGGYDDSSYYTTVPEIENPYIQAPYVEVRTIKEEYDENNQVGSGQRHKQIKQSQEQEENNVLLKKDKKDKKDKKKKDKKGSDEGLLYGIIILLLLVILFFILRSYKYI